MNSRSKGQRGEREIVEFWRAWGFPDAHRTPMSGGMQWKGDVQGVPGLHLEVKRSERATIWAWIEQAEKDCPEGNTPVVVFRRNRSGWYAALPLEDFARVWTKVYPGRNETAL